MLSALLLATACGAGDDAASDVPEDTTEVAGDTDPTSDSPTTESTDTPAAEEPDACELLPIAELNEVAGLALAGEKSQVTNCFYGDFDTQQQLQLQIIVARDLDKIAEEMREFFGVESEEVATVVPGVGDEALFEVHELGFVQLNASKGRNFVRINAGELGIGVEELAALARIVLDRLPT